MKLLIHLCMLLASTLAVNITTIYQYPNGTWLENIAQTHNSSLLVTVIDRPEVHIIDPTIHPATHSLVTSFPNANSVLGITELSRDLFAVAVGNLTPSNTPIEGSFSIWTIDLTSCDDTKIDKLVDLKNVSMVNGIASLNPHTLLLADSWAGNIIKLDIKTKTYATALTHPSLASNFSNPSLPIGVNGIRIHANYLYYTNTVQNLLGRVKVDRQTGKVIGPWEIIKQGSEISQPDDFAVRGDGIVVLARPLGDTVQVVGRDGGVREIVRGGEGSGGTSVVLAREGRGKVVYVCESGLVGGVSARGGSVVRIEF